MTDLLSYSEFTDHLKKLLRSYIYGNSTISQIDFIEWCEYWQLYYYQNRGCEIDHQDFKRIKSVVQMMSREKDKRLKNSLYKENARATLMIPTKYFIKWLQLLS